MIASPLGGRLGERVGSKVPLAIGAALTTGSFVLLIVAHSSAWQIYLASLLLGAGVGFAFASLANLIVAAVRPDQTGVATGMNAVMRTIGGAVGGQIAVSILASQEVAGGFPSEHSYLLAFGFMTAVLIASILASFAVPGIRRTRSAQLVLEPSTSLD
jgi:MFS family permease